MEMLRIPVGAVSISKTRLYYYKISDLLYNQQSTYKNCIKALMVRTASHTQLNNSVTDYPVES